MKITKIERQINNQKRYSVFIDDKFAFGLSDVDVLYYKLQEFDEITIEKYNKILEDVIFVKAKEKSFSYLSYKPRTYKEVTSKLKIEQFSEEVIDSIMKFLQKYDYVNDEKYAEEFVRSRVSSKGLGRHRLESELKQKGIDSNIINKIFSEYEFDELEMVIQHIYKKTNGNKRIETKEKNRCFNYLLRKGFSYELINKGFKMYFEEDDSFI